MGLLCPNQEYSEAERTIPRTTASLQHRRPDKHVSTHTFFTYFSIDMATVDLNITYRPYVHMQPTHTEPPPRGNDESPGVI